MITTTSRQARLITLGLGVTLLTAFTQAAPPNDPSFTNFSVLLTRSPFKIEKPPAPPEEKPVITALLSLRGVTQFDDGWVVTVIDRKDPKTPIRIHEGTPTKGLTLIKVNKINDDYTKTTVIIKQNGRQMSVGYNTAEIKKNLATKAPSPSKTIPRPTSTRPTIPRPTSTQTPAPTTGTSSTRRPSRIRRVPVPTPSK